MTESVWMYSADNYTHDDDAVFYLVCTVREANDNALLIYLHVHERTEREKKIKLNK